MKQYGWISNIICWTKEGIKNSENKNILYIARKSTCSYLEDGWSWLQRVLVIYLGDEKDLYLECENYIGEYIC